MCFLLLWALHDPTRVWFYLPVPFVLLLSGSFVDAVFSLSLSQALGKVWVSPCVFVATLSHYYPYFEVDTYFQVTSRACFFALPTTFVFLVVVGLGWLWSLWASLSLCLSLSLLVVLLRSEHECRNQTERGGGLSDGAPAYHRNYPCHQNDYMQLFLFSGIDFLKITITITFLIPSQTDSREM